MRSRLSRIFIDDVMQYIKHSLIRNITWGHLNLILSMCNLN